MDCKLIIRKKLFDGFMIILRSGLGLRIIHLFSLGLCCCFRKAWFSRFGSAKQGTLPVSKYFDALMEFPCVVPSHPHDSPGLPSHSTRCRNRLRAPRILLTMISWNFRGVVPFRSRDGLHALGLRRTRRFEGIVQAILRAQAHSRFKNFP